MGDRECIKRKKCDSDDRGLIPIPVQIDTKSVGGLKASLFDLDRTRLIRRGLATLKGALRTGPTGLMNLQCEQDCFSLVL